MFILGLLPWMALAKGTSLNEARGPNSRIIGGHPAERYSRPFQIVVFGCSGSILSKRIILTAAHCVSCPNEQTSCEQEYPYKYTVVSGEHDKGKEEGDEQSHFIQWVHIHEKYYQHGEYDLAILILASDIEFDKARQPIALPKKSDTNFTTETRFVASGWGTYSDNGAGGRILHEVELPWVNCSNPDIDLCAGGETGNTCPGDSGGPLTWFDESEKVVKLVGVTSRGYGCEPPGSIRPAGAYAKVTHVLDWINEFM